MVFLRGLLAVLIQWSCLETNLAADMTMGLCGVIGSGWAVQDNMGLYLALLYWNSGPESLAGGLPRPASPLQFNVSVVELDSGCSSSTSFNSAMSVFNMGLVDVINGCVCSSASIQVGRFSTALEIPMMATTSQSSLLSNKADYPYLFRWCTTEITDADMHASVLAAMNIQRYTILYIDFPKNVLAKDSLLANPSVQDMEVLVVRLPDIDMRVPENYDTVASTMLEARMSRAWVFVMYLSTDVTETNKDDAILAGLQVGLFNNYSIALLEEVMITRLNGERDLDEFARAHLVGSIAGRAKPVAGRHQAWLDWMTTVSLESLQDLGFDSPLATQAWLTDAHTVSLAWHAFRFDATIALLMVLQDIKLRGEAVTTAAIMEGILNLPLKGIMGDLSWDANLNRQGLVYEILQLQYPDDTATWPASLVQVGETVLTPDENGLISATLNTSMMRFQTSGPGTTPRRELLYPEAPPCQAGWTKPDDFAPPAECNPCSRGTFNSEATGNACIACQSGLFGSEEAATRCQSCIPGSFSNSSGSTACYLCIKGSATSVSGATTCLACEAGHAAGEEGLAECPACQPGTVAEGIASTSCDECAQGYAQVAAGTTACQACQPGRYAASSGVSECIWCPESTFQSVVGSSECDSCGRAVPGSTTQFRLGSVSMDACVCDTGFFMYRPAEDADLRCEKCPEGVICPGGNFALLQEAGYHTGAPSYFGEWPDPIVFCSEVDKCPSGRLLGFCPDHREGRGCDQCEAGYTPSSGSACLSCGDGDYFLPIVLASMGSVVGLVGLTVYGVQEVNVVRQSVLTAMISSGLMLNGVQSVSVFSQLSLEWVDPMKSIARMAKLLVFNIEVLRMECVTGSSDPKVIYLFSVIIFPLVVLAQSLIFVALRACTRVQVDVNRGLNIIGLISLIAYLSLALNSLVPWQCKENPDGSASVLTYRSTLCYESDAHIMMLVVSCVAILFYVVGFLALVSWATYVYPFRVASPSGSKFLKKFQFLFNRFIPSRYYYGVIFVLRNLLIAALPVLLVNEPQAQVLTLVSIITGCGAIECLLMPWRGMAANLLSAAFTVGLNLMLCAGALLLESHSSRAELVVQGFLALSLLATFGLALLVVAVFMGQAIFAKKKYAVFLCHHKGGAGVLARLFKMVLQERINAPIFLDSDQLDSLSTLFDVVAHQTRNLMVILTQQILTRMWCAGEITTAYRKQVPTVPVCCDDYIQPTDKFIESLESLWTDGEQTELSSLGIDILHVKAAFTRFREARTFVFHRALSLSQQEQLVIEAAGWCVQLRIGGMATRTWASSKDINDNVFLIGDEDVEAVCATQILRRYFAAHISVPARVIETAKDIPPRASRWTKVVGVLTKGVLERPLFAHTLVNAHIRQVSTLGVTADTSFQFPGADYWERLREGKAMALSNELLQNISAEQIEVCYKSCFRTIAKVFSPKGSERIQKAEVEDMARWLSATKTSLSSTALGRSGRSDNGVTAITRDSSERKMEALGSGLQHHGNEAPQPWKEDDDDDDDEDLHWEDLV